MWTDSPVIASASELIQLLQSLWRDAARVDLALADPAWMAGTLPGADISCPRVRALVSSEPSGDRIDWQLWLAAEPPSPEMILAYRGDAGFPALAILLGGVPDDPFAIVQRRPITLKRLLERFESMLLQARSATLHPGFGRAAVGTETAVRVREQGSRHEKTEPQGSDSQHREPVVDTSNGETVVAPEALYRLVLACHFEGPHGLDPAQGPEARLSAQLAAHQKCALERASAILDRYGGVIVADSVGLGKTFVGLGLLTAARSEGQRTLVVTPASLRGQWRKHLGYLAGHAGSRPEPSESDDGQIAFQEDTGRVDLVSMESLGRSSFDPECFESVEFVLVDEAHNFRNPRTNRYRSLARIVRHARVALLTATPVNNSLLDLSALIDLFAAPGAFRHLGVGNYRASFRRGTVDGDVRKVVAACVVRRTRRFLRAHYGAVTVRDAQTGEPSELRFPKRLPPRVISYDLDGTYGQLLGELEAWLDSLRFASPSPDDDPPPDFGGAEALLKIILLKRLESSVQAFRRSLVQQLAWCDTALRALGSGRVLTRPDYRASFRGPADDPGSQLALFELMLPPASLNAEALNRFRRDLQHDRDLLSDIHRRLSGHVGARADRKLEALRRVLTEELNGEKVIIFTEFRDTARYLHGQLRDLAGLGVIDSGQARLGLEPAARNEVIARFAPISNGVPQPPAIERVNVLIATDVLSEGLNLQDASAVISYDLPWNPVRLMQRVGRVDRLGAVADAVEPLCFVPAHQLERLLGLMDRLQSKVATIGATFGLDQTVLPGLTAVDVNDSHRVKSLLTDPRELDRLEEKLEGPPDPEELAYIDHVRLFRGSDIEPPEPPAAAVVKAPAGAIDRPSAPMAVGYWRLRWVHRARGLWMIYDPETRCVVEDPLTAVQRFRWAIGAGTPQPRGVVISCYDGPLIAQARQAFARFANAELARIEAARIAGDRLLPTLPQCRIAAWLARILERNELQLDPETRRRIDRIATGLACRFAAQVERALAVIANELPESMSPAVLDRLQQVVATAEPTCAVGGSAEEVGTLLLVGPSQARH